ncbi:MAG: hypothetical protein H6832_06870 [Planctomycetes bacterium]|nr:hypothetical protein [Planctomycetota bacterium]MCB9918109.1 hypothetical protein [Planctomycetota bacterium]
MEEDLKSFARKLVSVVNTLAALGSSVYFVLVWLDRTPSVSPAFLALLGAGVLLLNVFRLLYFRAGRRREEEGPLLSHTQDGIVQVSREAVEAGLRNVGEALDEVTRLRVKVLTPGRKRTLVRAHYLAPEGVQILDLSSKLRRSLLTRFRELVSTEPDAKIEVEMVFEGFYGKARAARPAAEPEPSPREKAPAEDSEPPPFTGPRYPIDLEGEENPS